MRAFVVRHWESLREGDAASPEARRVVLERACAEVRRVAGGGPGPGELMPLLEAQAPSLSPLEVLEEGEADIGHWQPVFDLEFLLTVSDDLMALLEEARVRRESELVADLATSGEVLESLHAGLAGIEQISAYARTLAELRGTAVATRAVLLRERGGDAFLRDAAGGDVA
jgi:hypothetical protein